MPVVKYIGARVGEEPLRNPPTRPGTAGTLRYFSTGQDGNIITAARKLYSAYFSPIQHNFNPIGRQNGIDIYLLRAPAENPPIQYLFRVWVDEDEVYHADPIQQAGGGGFRSGNGNGHVTHRRRYQRAK